MSDVRIVVAVGAKNNTDISFSDAEKRNFTNNYRI